MDMTWTSPWSVIGAALMSCFTIIIAVELLVVLALHAITPDEHVEVTIVDDEIRS